MSPSFGQSDQDKGLRAGANIGLKNNTSRLLDGRVFGRNWEFCIRVPASADEVPL